MTQGYDEALGLYRAGRLDDAAEACERIIASDPSHAQALHLLGLVEIRRKRMDAAEQALRRAAMTPQPPAGALLALGKVLGAREDWRGAAEAYARSVQIDPTFFEGWRNLGECHDRLGDYERSAESYERAVTLRPDDPAVRRRLATALGRMEKFDEAFEHFRKYVELNPADTAARSELLNSMHYLQPFPADEVFAAHVDFGRRYANIVPRFTLRDRSPDRPLRVGYVSADFYRHSVAFFIEPVIEHHDRSMFEVFLYADVVRSDEVTDRFRTLAGAGWREITRMRSEQVVELITRDEIDVLVDLGGHTFPRLDVFAHKPAPVQVTYLGYPDTTGLQAMDYRLTDVHADPPGVGDERATERLIRLPRTAWVYRPPPGAPDVRNPPPSPSKGFVTFGTFNKRWKVTREAVASWSQVLNRVPGARLKLKSDAYADPRLRERFLKGFTGHGVDPARIELLEKTPTMLEHLSHYHDVDVALDTFPYNGTTTTCEAMWMGLPVVTSRGDVHMARVGASLLTNVGLAELMGQNVEQYVEIAVALARDARRLVELRRGMRERMKASPLRDEVGVTRDIEQAYRRMWVERVAEIA